MGMFNIVVVPEHLDGCDNCGQKDIGEWQTKDNEPLTLGKFKFEHQDINKCYNMCPKCDAWVELEKGIFDGSIVTKSITLKKAYTL